MRDSTTRRPSTGGPGPRDGDLSSLPPLIREKIMKDKPAELFRKDLITAMKVPDTEHLDPDAFWAIIDPWKPDYDKGVQIPVNAEAVPVIMVKQRKITTAMDAILGPFMMPQKLISVTKRDETFNELIHEFCDTESIQRKLESKPRYNIDTLDFAWLQLMNRQREACGLKELSEEVLERVVDDLETRCHNNLQSSQLGIEYDEDTQCDVCLSPESEEGNEMVFCDQCDLCVHQACYGIMSVPAGSWLCVPCARGYNIKPQCALCPLLGGALKPDSDLDLWAHVACALWVPEITIGNPELMQPLQNLHRLPAWRRKLTCSICRKEGLGVCIQCSVKGCEVAYHVTCAQKAGLTMNMDLHEGAAQDALELKSYCRKHGKKTHKSPNKLNSKEIQSGIIENGQQQFYDFVNPHETAAHLRSVVDPLGADQIFNYWKLKRISCQGKPLLPPKHEESLKPPVYIDDELSSTIRTLVHVRQDLERARNLSYLLQRREKTKKIWIRAREDVTMTQLRAAEEHPECLRVIRTANRLDDIYDRLHSFEKIYGYPAYSVSSSLMRIVAEAGGTVALSNKDLTSPKKRSPIKHKGVSHTPDTRQKLSKKRGRPLKRRKLAFEGDENRPFHGSPLSKEKQNGAQRCSSSLSAEIVASSPPLTTLSSPPSSLSSTQKFLRIGRRRGGPFKRSMIPDLQKEIPPHDKHTPNLRMMRKNQRRNMSRPEASPRVRIPSNQQTSTDYDSDTSVEILTGEELVQSMSNRKKTRRKSRHRRSALVKKDSIPQTDLQTRSSRNIVSKQMLLKNSLGNAPDCPLRVGVGKDERVLPGSSNQRTARRGRFKREKSGSRAIRIVPAELNSNSIESKRKLRTTIVSLSLPPQVNLEAEPGEVRVLRHRDITKERSRLPSNVKSATAIEKKTPPEAIGLKGDALGQEHLNRISSPVFCECSVRIKKLSYDDLEPYSKRELRSGHARKKK